MAQPDWNQLIAELGPPLLLFARQYLPNTQDAEAVVQEAFIRLWKRKLADNMPETEIRKLLYVCVRNAAFDHLRSEKRRRRREQTYSTDMTSPVSLFETTIEKEELRQQVERLLGTLPEAQRVVLTMKIWSNMTFQEIADTLGLSLGTAASRYRLGLEALRRRMSQEVFA